MVASLRASHGRSSHRVPNSPSWTDFSSRELGTETPGFVFSIRGENLPTWRRLVYFPNLPQGRNAWEVCRALKRTPTWMHIGSGLFSPNLTRSPCVLAGVVRARGFLNRR